MNRQREGKRFAAPCSCGGDPLNFYRNLRLLKRAVSIKTQKHLGRRRKRRRESTPTCSFAINDPKEEENNGSMISMKSLELWTRERDRAPTTSDYVALAKIKKQLVKVKKPQKIRSRDMK